MDKHTSSLIAYIDYGLYLRELSTYLKYRQTCKETLRIGAIMIFTVALGLPTQIMKMFKPHAWWETLILSLGVAAITCWVVLILATGRHAREARQAMLEAQCRLMPVRKADLQNAPWI
jgi:L-asparagine transporter-like permease